ncbi:MAG TPA: DUF5069 domain-containing protein, partial [Chloroflexota bacterium]|nr:DUF5069 domain-containing protein [Chloroflexota bacterium]
MTQAEARAANDVRDGGVVDGEWKPRPRARVIGGIEWLARMSDKARAKANGTIGDYIYPCPADKKLLAALEIDPDTFQQLATKSESDDELVQSVKQTSPAFQAGTFQYTRQD